MKARDFYKAWNNQVQDEWSRLGLTRMTGRGSRWTLPLGDLLMLVFVEVNPKYAWSLEGGGNFSLYACLPREKPGDPAEYQEQMFDTIHCFSYLDDSLKAEIAAQNRSFCDKLKGMAGDALFARMAEKYDCTPAQARELGLLEGALTAIEMDIDSPVEAWVNPSLYYYDNDDIASWARYFQRALPVMLEGVADSPRYAFATDG